jgi:putative acetyltransferase
MISKATEKDYLEIIDVWEQSVRATHHFLPEDYLQEIKNLLPSILPALPVYVFKAEEGIIKGILGVTEKKIEMLFIHPESRGQGIGKLLTLFAIDELKAEKVDVNEQNEQAVGFYLKMGFVQTGRTDTDSIGKPFPLLLMELPAAKKII